MKKKYVIELEEITCCGECKFKEKDKSNCPMYNEFSGCPLTELKPKELEWKEVEDTGQYVADIGFAEYVIKSEYFVELRFKHQKGGFQTITVSADVPGFIENKKKAQDHYNRLFCEMIGG